MNRKLICISAALIVFILGPGVLKADITIEMKSSISGIPFLQAFEMNQMYGIQGDRMISTTDGEVNAGDTSIAFKSAVYFDFTKGLLRSCSWEDSACVLVNLSSIEQLVNAGLEKNLMDTIRPYLEKASDYVQVTNASVTKTDNRKRISGYDCNEVVFDFSGTGSPHLEQMQGDIKFSFTGSMWVTKNFPHADEYEQVMSKMKTTIFTPKLQDLINEIFGYVGIGPSFLKSSLDLMGELYVEGAFNMKLELWAEGMEVPSMSFNMRVNSVLVDISFDKISSSVFEAPPNFSTKEVDLLNLFK